MPRIVKPPEERKKELLDAAWDLFFRKGYENTSVNDIITTVGVAKGTFYHYFKSKDALMDELARRHAESHIREWEKVLSDDGLNALEKLNTVLDASKRLKLQDRDLALLYFRMYYNSRNSFLRYKINREVMKKGAETLSRIIEEGCREGVFTTPYPRDAVRILIKLGNDLMEELVGYLIRAEKEPEVMEKVARSYEVYRDVMERILGVASGSIDFFDKAFLTDFFKADNTIPDTAADRSR
jgi:AcrR family transcriptional regulator